MELHAMRIDCPWCGERIDSAVDASAGSGQYVEDCAVCCRPIVFVVEIGGDGEVAALHVARE